MDVVFSHFGCNNEKIFANIISNNGCCNDILRGKKLNNLWVRLVRPVVVIDERIDD